VQQSQTTAYRIKLQESESLVKQIKNLHRNKFKYQEEATKLLGVDERIAIQQTIENIDNQIAEKAIRMHTILEQISQQEIFVPALDE